MNLFQMSLYGSILILVVLVIRGLLINSLPKKTFLFLWGITLVRLLIPYSLPSKFSLYSFICQIKIPSNQTAVSVIFDGSSPQQKVFTQEWYTVVWIIGIIVLSSLFLILYLHHRWSFKTSLPVNNSIIYNWLSKHKTLRKIQVRKSTQITSPLTYGIFKPVILLPDNTDWNNEQQLDFVLLHEYIHIKHFDAVLKLITIVCLCLHWFNPLVWIMYFMLNRDIELCCDESVIKSFGEKFKSSYALTLINMEEKKSVLRPFCSNYSKLAIEERIVAIMKTKKLSRISLIISTVLIVATIAVFTTSAVANKDEVEKSISMPKTSNTETDTTKSRPIEKKNDEKKTKVYEEIIDESDNSKLEISTIEDCYLIENLDGVVQVVDKKTEEPLCEITVEEDEIMDAE